MGSWESRERMGQEEAGQWVMGQILSGCRITLPCIFRDTTAMSFVHLQHKEMIKEKMFEEREFLV